MPFEPAMPQAWQVAPLSDLTAGDTVTYGVVQPGSSVSGGVPMLRVNNFRGFGLDTADVLRIAPEIESKYGRTRLQADDVLITIVGSVGQVAIVPKALEGWNIARAVALVRPKAPSMARWIALFLRSPIAQHALGVAANTTVQTTINLKDLKQLSVPIPPEEELKGIAGTLSALDDKIALLRETNATLEAIAQALFKSWFVDFDPVRAKAEGRDPEGVPPEVANLFPSEFEDSELGEIPKGWGYVRVDMLYSGLYDGPHSTPAPSDAGPVFLGIKNFLPTRLDLSEVRHISEEDWPKWTRRVTPQAGDILFTYEATLGFFALVPEGLRCCLGRRTALVRPKSEMGNGPFLLHSFVSKPFQDLLVARRNHGSTVDRIPLTDFPSYPVLWPGERLARSFSDVVAPLWERIHRNQSQMQWLTEIRDTLLPRLMSGKLRIPQLGGLQ